MTREERKTEAKKAYAAFMKFYPFTLENLGGEQWADIANYEGLYQVSTFGRVKSFQKGETTIRKPWVDKCGYLYVDLYKDGKRGRAGTHQLVARAFVPNPDNKLEVNHEDGHPLNNHVSNLSWVTTAENKEHALRTGLILTGDKCSWAKLTDEQATYIRENPNNLSTRELADKFGIHRQSVSEIQLGRTRKQTAGEVRQSKVLRTPENVCNQIRAEYKRGVVGCGRRQLAKKFNLSPATIYRIVNEK